MCIGNPMFVIEVERGLATVAAGGRVERVDTRLVGEVSPGDWLLIFQGAARERLTPERAEEIASALELLEAAMRGDVDAAAADPGFVLPSAMDAATLAALTGETTR